MLCSTVLQQCCFALFLLCSPVPHHGRPIDASSLSSRIKRSVSHAQLMHDKGRTLWDIRRRMWLKELLDEVHTADIRDLAVQTTAGGGGGGGAAGGSSSGAGVGLPGVGLPGLGLPGVGLGINPSTTGSTLHSKPPGGTKNLSFQLEEEEGTNLPQETNKSQTYKDGVLKAPGKKKKKGRSGKRREGEKRKRRARSLGWRPEDESGSGLHLEWRSLLGLRRALQ
ncbi:parathyroid hormone-like hormone a [Mugil cephalus]|uniref:parathyroid hormone-like hormone a n=1 Tax=Mugil cephalus TaxID=48193 RepID=UPI001FB80D8D|nr:parathyroid hormone-like hormone a [Mugil cephalus]XP_047431483.1 parathyroid hormone-like hormone a [Mugil cephalus]XP_047431484.1 parathyroid hormone-like hormone a [Mugil cephalus]